MNFFFQHLSPIERISKISGVEVEGVCFRVVRLNRYDMIYGAVKPECRFAHTDVSVYFSVRRRNMSKRGESFGISRIGSKIKGVFKSTTMEGAMLPPSAMNELDDDLVRVFLFQVFKH